MKTSIPKLHSYKPKTGRNAENVEFPEEFLPAETIPVIAVLEGAAMANLRDVVLIGYEQDGTEYIAGSVRSPKDGAYMFARGQLNMLRAGDDD